MPGYKVTDTITYARAFYVIAENEGDAIAMVSDCHTSVYGAEPVQIDNTPYSAGLVERGPQMALPNTVPTVPRDTKELDGGIE